MCGIPFIMNGFVTFPRYFSGNIVVCCVKTLHDHRHFCSR
ncbi:hypothetical protein MY9_3656 [Bacillus sp. JS]|nr:hypothetical protein MY9_3656 [Bacillus sp. JS]